MNTEGNHKEQLYQLRQLFSDAAPTDPKVINDYAWIIAKALIHEQEQMGSVECRQLLADYFQLSVERPSRLHSAILSAAVKVANTYPEFRFLSFLRMWGLQNLRAEDYELQRQNATPPGSLAPVVKTFPSLAERVAKAVGLSLILRPEDMPVASGDDDDFTSVIAALLTRYGYSIRPMIVTRINEAANKDGRKFIFVTLTSADGIEVETVAHNLQASPLHPLPEGKRHFANIGQLYHVLVRAKGFTIREEPQSILMNADSDPSKPLTFVRAYESQQRAAAYFPTAIGYVEAIDANHGHMHVYDQYSRHFVARVQRFSREQEGDFVHFLPVIPAQSKFKTAILLATLSPNSPEVQGILRDIRITTVNREKGYAAWELMDRQQPIAELLSPYQLSQGEQSPGFINGYLFLSIVPEDSSQSITEGSTYKALIYLKRGKDRQKRPFVARLF